VEQFCKCWKRILCRRISQYARLYGNKILHKEKT